MADFMSHDAGKFAFILRGDDGAGVHRNEATGQRESVERRITNWEEMEAVRVRLGTAHERVAQVIEKFRKLRIRKKA